MDRNLSQTLKRDLEKKFVFLSGPRQVGKTTLAKKVMQANKGSYLLYDDDQDRAEILKKNYVHEGWVCLDEFHKYPRWKSHLKGVYDKYHEQLHLLLTGSARLDIYQRSGDSLLGRYYLHHLHPLTLGELHSDQLPGLPVSWREPHAAIPHLQELVRFGGFPEPFSVQSETEHRRWSNSRRTLLIREDLRELTQIQLLNLLEQLMILLPERVGSPFSYAAVSEILQTNSRTIQNWMGIFEHLFIAFKVQPYSKKITRAIMKQPKYYLYDWSQHTDAGSRFENLVASHLFKAVQIWTDVGYANLELRFVRDRDGREVDFLVLKEGRPWFLLEAKLAETKPAESLVFFSGKLGIPGVQLVEKDGIARAVGNNLVVSANQWLGLLP